MLRRGVLREYSLARQSSQRHCGKIIERNVKPEPDKRARERRGAGGGISAGVSAQVIIRRRVGGVAAGGEYAK